MHKRAKLKTEVAVDLNGLQIKYWSRVRGKTNGEGGIRTLGTRLKVQRFSKAASSEGVLN